MKIVYIDTNTLGHHLFYIGALSQIEGNEVVVDTALFDAAALIP
jgi:hypothetical protein